MRHALFPLILVAITEPRYRVRNTCGSNEPRPHLIPKSGKGRQLVEIDASGFIGRTGQCAGVVTLKDGSKTLAYGVINITDDAAADLMEQLDVQIDQLERAATC